MQNGRNRTFEPGPELVAYHRLACCGQVVEPLRALLAATCGCRIVFASEAQVGPPEGKVYVLGKALDGPKAETIGISQ